MADLVPHSASARPVIDSPPSDPASEPRTLREALRRARGGWPADEQPPEGRRPVRGLGQEQEEGASVEPVKVPPSAKVWAPRTAFESPISGEAPKALECVDRSASEGLDEAGATKPRAPRAVVASPSTTCRPEIVSGAGGAAGRTVPTPIGSKRRP